MKLEYKKPAYSYTYNEKICIKMPQDDSCHQVYTYSVRNFLRVLSSFGTLYANTFLNLSNGLSYQPVAKVIGVHFKDRTLDLEITDPKLLNIYMKSLEDWDCIECEFTGIKNIFTIGNYKFYGMTKYIPIHITLKPIIKEGI